LDDLQILPGMLRKDANRLSRPIGTSSATDAVSEISLVGLARFAIAHRADAITFESMMTRR
jgi:hypothetical protein